MWKGSTSTVDTFEISGVSGICTKMFRSGVVNGGFRSSRGCIDQIFVFKQLVQKYREKRKELHVAFTDLVKAYDKVGR